MNRRGLTMIEVIISIGVFTILMAIAFDAMLRMRSLASTVEDIDQLDEQALSARAAIRRDIGNSAWFYCIQGLSGLPFYPQVHRFGTPAIPLVPTTTVSVYDTTGTLVTRSASVTTNFSTTLGDAFVFVRLAAEGVPVTNTPPARMGISVINMNDTAVLSKPVRLDAYAKARPISSIVVQAGATDASTEAAAVWETTPAQITAGLMAVNLYDDTRVRLFCYRVEPDSATGRGILRRYYSNPTTSVLRNALGAALVTGSSDKKLVNWTLDADILADVIGFRVETAERTPTLALNQIRFVIDLGRNISQKDLTKSIDSMSLDGVNGNIVSRDSKQGRSTRRIELTLAMRSITNGINN